MRALSVVAALFLLSAGLVAFLPGATAGPLCIEVPAGNGMLDACTGLELEACSAFGFCVDPADPRGTADGLVAWAKDQLGPCICDPGPDGGP